ncbi:AAC(3) family N-acetyltransferase [Weizmannia acidilactici]|uniref:Aminoglycoside N(3)-acetyltransferase n=1 Tax=Weizmannia acidilactici TaxID=2607726 RepID=A0A5J4JJS2_9BACI|nr:AAC(3) family N-acetyltransferase [Weizmannia acidilactici]GER66745.1 AAC(3) family N-acetyltransferase [Weizmannia acidilactici]GER70627.1 AAC(3) family N-acetyltransferase [Weizmannia acidilactici]GER73800.1 AAC(3) family N-acetyltransferase [Weizmannia acidilactici]
MSEEQVIRKKHILVTKERLMEDFRKLGLAEGMTVIVHSSLSSIGWVCGGEVAVIQALMEVITNQGTIVMPAQTTNNSDPAYWENPPIPEEWWDEIRKSIPAFDPRITPTYGMGRIAELFRTFPGVLRSNHPNCSFTAWGRDAKYIVEGHSLDFPFGEKSPLARIYDKNGYILLLGVDYLSNTSMHLGEYRSSRYTTVFKQSCAMMVNGKRVWKSYKDYEENSDLFNKIGRAFERSHKVKTGFVGAALSRLMKQRALVDFTEQFLDNSQKHDEGDNE